MTLRIGELFAGAGGIGAGAKMAEYPFVHEWATDIDADACETYRQNLSCPTVINSDVRDLDFTTLAPVDVLTFGFPCGPFSQINPRRPGTKKGDGELYKYCTKALKHFKPLAFLGENTHGLLTLRGGEWYREIMTTFIDAGYRVHSASYNFAKYGVPQNRKRLVFAGFHHDLELNFRPPSHRKEVTPRTALADIPPLAENHQQSRLITKWQELLRKIPPGGTLGTTASISDKKRKNSFGSNQYLRRVFPDTPSFTVMTATTSAGGLFHWDETRRLTNRELARLQTFPDDHVFTGTLPSVCKQIGMSFPPVAAAAFLDSLAATLNGDSPGGSPELL